jgi:hypothetical protein
MGLLDFVSMAVEVRRVFEGMKGEAESMSWVFVAFVGSAWMRVEEKRGLVGWLGETELVVMVVSLVSRWVLVGKVVMREGWMVMWWKGWMGQRLAEGVVIRREE